MLMHYHLQANQTFVLFDKVNRYAKKVLLVGAEIKEFLGTESTEQNLITLQEIQLDLVNSPLSAALFSSKPAVTEFLSDPDITSKVLVFCKFYFVNHELHHRIHKLMTFVYDSFAGEFFKGN